MRDHLTFVHLSDIHFTGLSGDSDRGKEPQRLREDYPWFWGWDEKVVDFAGGGACDGFRWNDLHYTRAARLAARERQARGGAR